MPGKRVYIQIYTDESCIKQQKNITNVIIYSITQHNYVGIYTN